MPTAIEAITDDFRRELATIRDLLNVISQLPPETARRTGVRLASANASMLLLAASFEEYVREAAKDHAEYLIQNATAAGLPPALLGAIWERALFLLRGQKFGKQGFDQEGAISQLTALRSFCLELRPDRRVAAMIGYNANNMTVKEFNDVFKRLGLDDYLAQLSISQHLADLTKSESAVETRDRLAATWKDFYEERNQIAHSIGAYNTTGVGDIIRYIAMFEAVAEAVRGDLLERSPE